MNNVWEFRDGPRRNQVYANGDVVPHRTLYLYLNGEKVGELELHMHRRYGRDRKVDVSFGATFVVYGPPEGGR